MSRCGNSPRRTISGTADARCSDAAETFIGHPRTPSGRKILGETTGALTLGSLAGMLPGVPDKVIHPILRHSDVNVTLGSYIKSNSADEVQAMERLRKIWQQKTAAQGYRTPIGQ